MSRSKSFLALAFIAILPLGLAHAQQPAAVTDAPSAPTGSLTGFVYYDETRLPARFAEINLIPVPSETDLAPAKDKPVAPGKMQERERRVQRASGNSDMSGSFRIDGIPSGDYVIAAIKSGYLNPGITAMMDLALTEDQLRDLLASLTKVHIAAGQITSVNVTLHRGAVITGRMQFADGTPVIGVMVGCQMFEKLPQSPESLAKVMSPLRQALFSLASTENNRPNLLTDDEGRYRIVGLSPGKYVVTTMLVLNHGSGRVAMNYGANLHTGGREHMFPDMVAVYGPGTFSRKNAKMFEVRGDEQVTDADLTIDPEGLHTIWGKILAAQDHHAPNTMVRLQEDGAAGIYRSVDTEDDGTFAIKYLPSGSYALEIMASDALDQTVSGERLTEFKQYKTFKLTAVVGDQDVVLDDVLLTLLKPGETNPFPVF